MKKLGGSKQGGALVRYDSNWDNVEFRLRDTGLGAIREAAMMLLITARREAPVDTGFLRSSIQMSQVNDHTYIVTVGAYYAGFVEHGYTMINGVHVAANPFFRRAQDEVEMAWPQIVQVQWSHDEGAYENRVTGPYMGSEFTNVMPTEWRG